MGGTLPLIEKSCNLQHTKNCATFATDWSHFHTNYVEKKSTIKFLR